MRKQNYDARTFIDDIFRAFNTPGTRHHRMMRQFESKYEFKAFVQYTENFVCDDVMTKNYSPKSSPR